MLTLNGSQATITEHTSGLAATFSGNPYPHVQHIHINGKGTCPTPAADTNSDGVVNTTEGGPSYGPIGDDVVDERPDEPGRRNGAEHRAERCELRLQPHDHA